MVNLFRNVFFVFQLVSASMIISHKVRLVSKQHNYLDIFSFWLRELSFYRTVKSTQPHSITDLEVGSKIGIKLHPFLLEQRSEICSIVVRFTHRLTHTQTQTHRLTHTHRHTHTDTHTRTPHPCNSFWARDQDSQHLYLFEPLTSEPCDVTICEGLFNQTSQLRLQSIKIQ